MTRQLQTPRRVGETESDLAKEKLQLEVHALKSNSVSWLQVAQPYLLLLCTALISGLLIPYITRNWQLYEKELEIKSELAVSVNEAVATFLREIQRVEVDKVHLGQANDFAALNEAYHTWQVESSQLSGKISAYFPETAEDWQQFTEIMEEVYALTGTTDARHRKARVERLKNYIGESDVAWDALLDNGETWLSVEDARPFEAAWFQLRDELNKAKTRIVAKILKSRTALS